MSAAPVAASLAHTESKQCHECHSWFNPITRRRHHCKLCGKAVCDSCSRHTVRPNDGSSEKARVCDGCYAVSLVATHAQPQSRPSTTATITPNVDEARVTSFTIDAVPISRTSSSENDTSYYSPGAPLDDSHLSISPPTASAKSILAAEDAINAANFTPLRTSELTVPGHRPGSFSLTRVPLPVFVSTSPTANTVASISKIVTETDFPEHSKPSPTLTIVPPTKEVSSVAVAGAAPPSPSVTLSSASEPVSPTVALTQVLKHQRMCDPAAIGLVSPSTPGVRSPHTPAPLSPLPDLSSNIIKSTTVTANNNATTTIRTTTIADDLTVDIADGTALKLDLPMKLCLVILKKTASEMKNRYNEYLKTKETRQEAEPLSFAQYVFFSIIRTLPDFLFKKTELAYCLMRGEESGDLVQRESFVRYAPILQPLASKLDASVIFDLLAVDGSGINFTLFKAYVDGLKRECHYTDHWSDWRELFALPKTEKLITMRTGVTDTSHFPPHVGRVGLTSQHLIYESLIFKKRRCIKWHDIVRIERNEDGWIRRGVDGAGIKIHFWRENVEESEKIAETEEIKELEQPSSSASLGLHHRRPQHHSHEKSFSLSKSRSDGVDNAKDNVGGGHSRSNSKDANSGKGPVKVIHWDVPGIGHEAGLDRQRFFLYLRMVHTSHLLSDELHSRQPLIAAALLQETFDLVRRMRALETLHAHIDPMKLNPYGDFSELEREKFVARIREIVKKNEKVKDSKKNWLTSLLPGLAHNNEEIKGVKVDDIDPEFKPQYKTFEEMNAITSEQEPFTVKAFSYNVKLFTRQLQPVFALVTIVKSLRNWDHPMVTASVIAFLLNMCYRDFLCYMPAIVVLLNILIVIGYRVAPAEMTTMLARAANGGSDSHDSSDGHSDVNTDNLTLDFDDNAPVIISQVTDGQMNVASAVTVVEKTRQPIPSSKEEPQGLLAKLKQYRDVAFKTKDHLQTVQNELAAINLKTLKIEGLYQWRTPIVTMKLLGILSVLLFVLILIPFRFIFPFILLDFFTDKWQKDGSQIDRLLDAAGLPEQMPEVD